VKINYPAWDTSAPFGGYKQSGNGREYADWGLHDFLEIKGIIGYGTPQMPAQPRRSRAQSA
jgi:aldehyde dehydrogenase (NAD+)